MTEKLEHDFPPTMRYRHRRPRVEIIEPPEPPRYHRVEITVRHHRQAPPRFLPVLIAIVALLLLWRFKFGVLLAAIVGWQTVSMFVFVAIILALLAWRDRRASHSLLQ